MSVAIRSIYQPACTYEADQHDWHKTTNRILKKILEVVKTKNNWRKYSMKKYLVIFLAFLLMLTAIAGCQSSTTTATAGTTAGPTTGTTAGTSATSGTTTVAKDVTIGYSFQPKITNSGATALIMSTRQPPPSALPLMLRTATTNRKSKLPMLTT